MFRRKTEREGTKKNKTKTKIYLKYLEKVKKKRKRKKRKMKREKFHILHWEEERRGKGNRNV